MTYIRPQRQYRNGSKTSTNLYEVITNKATLNQGFSCGLRQGTWRNTPFKEVSHVPPLETISQDILRMQPTEDKLSDVSILFEAVCASIERSWQPDKFHVIFHSSGWDSRIISSAIKKLTEKNGIKWLGDILFLANRWEAKEAREIVVSRQGWKDSHFLAYEVGKEDEHFADILEFDTFWLKNNPPVPLPGNLWWYLPEYAQKIGRLPEDNKLQGYCGLFANETWRWFRQDGLNLWLRKHLDWYYYTTIAMHPQKILRMENPLTDIEVLKLVPGYKGYDGDKLREAVAHYGCPEAKGIIHHTFDDRGHPISRRLRQKCQKAYDQSWYGKRRKVDLPSTSEFNVGWCHYGLASLCEELIRRGIRVA